MQDALKVYHKKSYMAGGWGRGEGGEVFLKEETPRESPAGSVVRTPHFHCRGHGFNL